MRPPLLVLLSILFWGTFAGAQNKYKPICDHRDRRPCAVALLKGETAPYDGQLLTTDLAIRQGQKVEHCDARMAIEVDRANQLAEVKINLEKRLRAIDTEAYELQLKVMQKHLEKAGKRSWLEHPAVVATMTAVVVVGALYAGTQVVQVAAK